MAILSISFSSPLLPIPLCLCQAYLFSLHLSLFFWFTSSAALCHSVLLVSNCCIPHFKYPSTHFLSFICRCCFCAFIFLRICFFPDSSFLLPLSSSCSIWLCLSLPPTDFLLVYFPSSLSTKPYFLGGFSPSFPPSVLSSACHSCQRMLEVNDSSEVKSVPLICLYGERPVGGIVPRWLFKGKVLIIIC